MNIPPSGIVLRSGATPPVSPPPSPLASAANRVGAIAPVVGGTALTIASGAHTIGQVIMLKKKLADSDRNYHREVDKDLAKGEIYPEQGLQTMLKDNTPVNEIKERLIASRCVSPSLTIEQDAEGRYYLKEPERYVSDLPLENTPLSPRKSSFRNDTKNVLYQVGDCNQNNHNDNVKDVLNNEIHSHWNNPGHAFLPVSKTKEAYTPGVAYISPSFTLPRRPWHNTGIGLFVISLGSLMIFTTLVSVTPLIVNKIGEKFLGVKKLSNASENKKNGTLLISPSLDSTRPASTPEFILETLKAFHGKHLSKKLTLYLLVKYSDENEESAKELLSS